MNFADQVKSNGFAGGVKSGEDSGLAAYVSSLIDPTLSWKDFEWLKSITDLPILVKGILTGHLEVFYNFL